MNLMQTMMGKLQVLAVVALSLLLVGGNAAATPTGPDFSSILSGVDSSTAVTAILAGAVILALVGFAKWGAKKVGKFFG